MLLLMNPLISIFAILSILIGTFGALYQKTIKKLLAFSSIVNLGYIIIILTTLSSYSLLYCIGYIFIYLINLVSFFLIIFFLQNIYGFKELSITYISQLSCLFKFKPALSILFAVFIFSIAGLPPFGGFFAKYFILTDLVANHFYLTTLVILLISVLSTFYYIRLIKILFFNKVLIDFSNNSNFFSNNLNFSRSNNSNLIIYNLILLFFINIIVIFYPSILYFNIFYFFF